MACGVKLSTGTPVSPWTATATTCHTSTPRKTNKDKRVLFRDVAMVEPSRAIGSVHAYYAVWAVSRSVRFGGPSAAWHISITLAQGSKFWGSRDWTARTFLRPPHAPPHSNTVNMGRELQKKKNKSSIPKKRQKGPSKKKILQNPIIAKHWSANTT